MARKGNMPLFVGDDCTEPNVYIAREEDEMYTTWTTFWATKFRLRRRQDPMAVRSTILIATSPTSTSMRVTVPLALFHQPLAPWDKIVHAPPSLLHHSRTVQNAATIYIYIMCYKIFSKNHLILKVEEQKD